MAPSKMTANGNVKKAMSVKKEEQKPRKVVKKNVCIRKNKGLLKNVGKAHGDGKDANHPVVQKIKKIKNKNDRKKSKPHKKLENTEHTEKDTDEFETCSNESMTEVLRSNSIKDGKDAFTWLIAPVTPEKFFKELWERTPLHVKRNDLPDYYKTLFSTQKIDRILQENYVLFSKNVDVTSYHNGERKTHNPPGRATPAVVWDFYSKGCSVRMLNPQTFSTKLQKLNSALQEYFGCFVGANSYLTPADSQGFAPHYDDIEAFILQIEGKKHWKVYAPREPGEMLPRFSSENLQQNDVGQPVLDVTLHPGDLLYFPRGFIHQAKTEDGVHSLHVTVSCYQKNTWGDFLQKLLPAALSIAQEEDVEYRKGLPLDYLSHIGVSHCDQDTPQRRQFLVHLESLVFKLLKHAPVDATADQMGKQFMHDALPPILSSGEMNCSVFSNNNVILEDNGNVRGKASLTKNSRVKLLRAHVLRLVKEDDETDSVHLYHCIDNSLEYHGEEPQVFEVSSDYALAVEFLIHQYPAFSAVSDLPLDSLENKLELVDLLWKKGLLLTEKPLKRR